MADVNINPFGGHESRPDEPTDEHIPRPPVTPVGGGSTWKPACDRETSFGGTSHEKKILKENVVKKLYQLIGDKIHQRAEPSLHLFKLDKDGRLYYRGEPLMNRNGQLKTIGVIADTLGIKGLREMGFDISKTNLKPRHVLDLLEKLPSTSDITNADEIELQEIAKSREDLISQMKNDQSQTDGLFEYPLRELLGLDKQLRSTRGLLKVEVTKKVQLEENIKKEHRKLEELREHPGVYNDGI